MQKNLNSKMSLLKIYLIGALGNIIEWYDFAVYGFFATLFAKLFFVSHDELTNLLATFAVFTVGFLMRPLGAIIYGHIGDKLGRKKALIISVLMMSVCTFLLGCLPTYKQLGDWAPVLLTLLRLLQGLSAGGETGGSYTYVIEFTQKSIHGLVGGALMCMIVLGTLIGSSVAALFTSCFSETTLFAWAWRLPFLISIILGLFILYLRTRMQETPLFKTLQQTQKIENLPVLTTFKQHKKALLRIIGIIALGASSFYFVFVFLPTQVATLYHLPLNKVLVINSINMLITAIGLPLFGYFSDRVGRLPVLLIGALLSLFVSIPLLILIGKATLMLFALGQLLFALIVAFYEGPVAATVLSLVPTAVRYSTTSIGYNISFAIFGGLVPLIGTALLKINSHLSLTGVYLVIVAIISLVTVVSLYYSDNFIN